MDCMGNFPHTSICVRWPGRVAQMVWQKALLLCTHDNLVLVGLYPLWNHRPVFPSTSFLGHDNRHVHIFSARFPNSVVCPGMQCWLVMILQVLVKFQQTSHIVGCWLSFQWQLPGHWQSLYLGHLCTLSICIPFRRGCCLCWKCKGHLWEW